MGKKIDPMECKHDNVYTDSWGTCVACGAKTVDYSVGDSVFGQAFELSFYGEGFHTAKARELPAE